MYLAHTQPGFESIAAQEIKALKGVSIRETRTLPGKNGMIFFDYHGDVQDLLELRTLEDVFEVVLMLRDLPPTYAALKQLQEQVQRVPQLERALQHARQLQPGRGGHGKFRFRVVARQAGTANFRRVDAQIAVEKGIAARSEHRWQQDAEGGLEFWLTMFYRNIRGSISGDILLALRLSDEHMRHREYKIEHLPASLRPSVAAALVWLTQPRENDVFLDPMCGAATILIERAYAGRYRMLLGGDNNPEALELALANIGPRYKPIELRKWDARHLPLDAGSVTACAVNLPFGTQIGTAEQNRSLYPAVITELARVMRPAARLVLLSGDATTLADALRRARGWQDRGGGAVQILGHPARVFVLERA